MNAIPESHRDLLQDETGAFAYLATLMSNGSPQLTPLRFNTEGEFVFVNSALGHIKDRNMRARPRVAILIVDPKNPCYWYLQVRGQVVEVTENGGLDHSNTLSLKYEGKPWTPVQGQTGVIYRIQPQRAFADG